MAFAVVTVAAGGVPVVDVSSTKPALGAAVSEATNGRGLAVTKVAALGRPVTYVTGGLLAAQAARAKAGARA